MPFHDLSSFLAHLERHGDLHRVRVPVSADYEIPEIAMRAVREERPALLFENVTGSAYPVAINVLATPRRIEWALGRPPAAIGEELVGFAERLKRPSVRNLWEARGLFGQALQARTRRVQQPAVQEIVEPPNLDSLPILRCWPEDGGRFITFGLVGTSDPVTAERNLGLYRLHVFGPQETGMHWQIQKGGGFHHAVAEGRREALPVTVSIGADPCTLLAAIAPLPEGMDELAFAAFLRGAPTGLARARAVNAWSLAEAEFVLEGEVPAGERRQEGPFGDHFGHYSHAAPFPVFRVKTVTRRRRPVYLAAVVGKPPQEDKAIGEAVGAMMGPLVRVIHREIRDLAAYFEAGFHNLLVVSVAERYAKEGVRAALGLLGTGQLSLTKCLIVVDETVNPRDWPGVLRALRDHFDPSEDFLLLPGVPLDTLDFTSYRMNLGSKMILDATGRRAVGPGNTSDEVRPAPAATLPPGSRERRDRFLEELRRTPGIDGLALFEEAWLTVRVRGEGRAWVQRLVAEEALQGIAVIAVVSEDVPLDDPTLHGWGVFTRFDAARDVLFTESKLAGAWPSHRGRLGIDATFKPGYPSPVEMDATVRERVDQRWNEYWS